MKAKTIKKKCNLYNLAIMLIALLLTPSCAFQEKDRLSEHKKSYILYSENNSFGLMKKNNDPFFSLGINHIQAITYPTPLEIFDKKYNSNWSLAASDIKKNLLKWGFNTAGYGTPNDLRKIMPYMMPCQPLVQNSAYLGQNQFSYSDIFDPDIKEEIVKKIENMTREKDNPNLVGYYWTDTPMWDLEKARKRFGMNWVDFIKSLPEDAYGKRRYKEFKKDCTMKQYPAKDEEFLGIIAEEYYGLIGPATRKNDPNTLIFGERYLMDNHPKQVLSAALPFIDVLSIQPNGTHFIHEYYDDLYAFTGKPIIISTGMATFEEIGEALETAKSGGCNEIAIFHCVSSYPTPLSAANLAKIEFLKKEFSVHVGLSDHTEGTIAGIAATALGATLIEKHFTLSRTLGGVDSSFSLEPDEMHELVIKTDETYKALGNNNRSRPKLEKENKIFRRSLYFVQDLKVGEVITEKHVRRIRPGFGLLPKYYKQIINKKALRNIKKGERVSWEDFEK